ncbi:hypothetical protein ILUMI_17930 [Ignelater luminosus]|uniref:Laminin EGF-like domain-containing protein n=1 Tax=Ignelater luminosus TaxID=2038154 RepID=A0A8K0CPK9_IGNLU|nr:hypothetical protein ILUMI_17930 [Ignelater luminosus]
MLGTFSNIEEQSMCDDITFQCKCYKNVIGRNCDRCADGFYNIFSGRGCSDCMCDPVGSISKSCNAVTGQCNCKPGFSGLLCDRCEAFTYQVSSDICENCNCNPFGSKDLQCNSTGKCSCLKNVEGKNCNQCKENTYNLTLGCISCPPCYDFVQNSIRNFTKYLEEAKNLLEHAENNLPAYIQDYKHFLNEIKLLKAKIHKLLMEYEDVNITVSVEDAINNLNKKINDFHNEIIKFIDQLNHELDHKQIKSNIITAGTNLKEGNNLIGVCESALENATKISKSISRHNKTMSKLAKDSLKASQEIENKADELHNLSQNVNSSCRAACVVAEQFLNDQKAVQKQLEDLSKEVLKSEEGLETMRNYSKGFHEKTKNTKDKAYLLLENANSLEIPTTDGISSSLTEINNDLVAIDKIVGDLKEASDKIDNNKAKVKKDLEELESKQKDVDDKFELVQDYENRADKAIADVNNITESAKLTLENLKEYERIKQETEESLKNIPAIRAKIDAVTNNAQEIKYIFQNLSVIIEDMEDMKLTIDRVLELDKSDKIILKENLKLIEELEKQSEAMSTTLEEYHRKLKIIRSDIKDLKEEQDKIELDIKRLLEYTLLLNSVPTSKEDLDEVEKEILIMEDVMNTIDYLTKEKEKLKDEVKRVKDIIEGIPDDDPTLCESAKSEPKAVA